MTRDQWIVLLVFAPWALIAIVALLRADQLTIVFRRRRRRDDEDD